MNSKGDGIDVDTFEFQFEGLEIVSPILESHSGPLHFPRPPHLSKGKEENVNHDPSTLSAGRGGEFDPAKGHISLRGVIPRNSVSTIRETLRINLYGESREETLFKHRNKGRGCGSSGKVEGGGKRLSRMAVGQEEWLAWNSSLRRGS